MENGPISRGSQSFAITLYGQMLPTPCPQLVNTSLDVVAQQHGIDNTDRG